MTRDWTRWTCARTALDHHGLTTLSHEGPGVAPAVPLSTGVDMCRMPWALCAVTVAATARGEGRMMSSAREGLAQRLLPPTGWR